MLVLKLSLSQVNAHVSLPSIVRDFRLCHSTVSILHCDIP
jgi:hypothetical protein